MKGDHAKALNAGCDEYLAKPIEREQLEILVEKYLERN
jgi:CheY-like chemotaxis protein